MRPADAHADPGPLSRHEIALLASAHTRLSDVRGASVVAAWNGWSLAGCAALCVPMALADSALLLVGAGLAGAAWGELRGRTLLRAPDARAPHWLAWNQLATFSVVLLYCAWRVIAGLAGPRPSETPGLAGMLASMDASDVAATIDRFYPIALCAFYGAVATACALYQAGCAVYYLRKRAAVERYLAETPAWVREVQRACGAAR